MFVHNSINRHNYVFTLLVVVVKWWYSVSSGLTQVLRNLRRVHVSQWRTGEGLGCSNPPPEILKALQNRAKLNLIVKTVKNG